MKKQFLLLSFLLTLVFGYSQETIPEDDEFHVEEVDDTTKRDKFIHFFNEEDMLQWEPEEEPKEFKKKKKKRKVYYGIKTKKGFTKKGHGSHMEVEVFYYLKVFQEPNVYVKDIYWYNTQKRKIQKSRPNKIDPSVAKILHGPYKKIIDSEVVEKGVYFVGTKHARWEKWKKPRVKKYKDSIEVEEKYLISKTKWNRGFPKESEISYFDSEKTQLKEIIPIVDEDKHGYYFKFYNNGMMEEQGRYIHGEKVGKWYEYHKGVKRNFKKRVTVYTDPKTRKAVDPYVSFEWDDHGKKTFDKEVEDKQKALEAKKNKHK